MGGVPDEGDAQPQRMDRDERAVGEAPRETLGEAIAQIGARANWAYKTYQSYMNVLEKKGFVAAEKRGRDKFYAPAVSREACVEREKGFSPRQARGALRQAAAREHGARERPAREGLRGA